MANAKLHLISIECLDPLNDRQGDQVTLNIEPYFSWSSFLTRNAVVSIGEFLDFEDQTLMTLSIDNDGVVTELGSSPLFVQNTPPPYAQISFNTIRTSTYVLRYAVTVQNVPLLAIILFILAEALSLIAVFLLRLTDILQPFARSITKRYHQQLREQEQLRDRNRVQ